MDSADDDFGELYVDAKFPATTSSACDVESFKSREESELSVISEKNKGCQGTVKPNPQSEPKKFVVVANDSSPCVDAKEESGYSDNESDDDLNIVLKDNDSTSLPVASSSSLTNSGGYGYASAYNACFDPSLGMLQCGYGFSHPWSRTTFDVNLDAFEKKPWRNPGMDVSDFFNFGLNEQSWKEYCKPLGRAIEVESGTLERKPSVDSRRPRDSDPDVVIQVPLTDDVEELPSVTPVEARSLSISPNEASRSEDSPSDNRRDLKPSDDSIKDEAFVECLDDNAGSFSDEESTPSENCCSREVAHSRKEMTEEKKKEETFWNSDGEDTSSMETKSSRGDRVRISPTSSCSVGKNEESEDYETESLKDSASDDQREVSTRPRQARPIEHDVVSIKSGERSDRKHSRHRRSHEDSSKRHCGRAGYAVRGHKIIKDGSHTPDPDLGYKVRSRHGNSYPDSIKNWQNGPRFTLERDETEGRGFRHSQRAKCRDRVYPSAVDHSRRREHRFGRHNNKESPRGQGFDYSNVYEYEERLQKYTSRSSFNVNQRKYRSSFNEEGDQYGRHHCEEKYGHERSSALSCERNKERNRYERVRESYYQDSIPLDDVHNRYPLEYSSAHGNPRQSHEFGLQSRRRSDDEYNFHRHRYEDRVHRAEVGVPVELAYREMHSFAAVGRREFQEYERNGEFLEIDKRHNYSPDWHLDRFVSEKDGYYKYRIEDTWPAPSLSLRDHCPYKGHRGDSWRDDTRDFTTEAYDSQNGRSYKAAPRDGWTQNRVRSDYASIQDRLACEDDWVRHDRRRYPLADEIQYSTREVTRSEHPSYTDEMFVRDIRMPIHNRLSTKQRSGYFKSRVHEIDERHHRSKKLRGDRHNTFSECQGPVDLTGRQGKLAYQSKKRFSNGGDTTEQSDGQKPRKLLCRSHENAVKIDDLTDKEEGEIVEETRNLKGGGVEMINNERIQESLKKMEKRRERFKETESVKTVEAIFESETEPKAKTNDFTNQQRPIRKRRWCGA